MEQVQWNVEGMDCASCAAAITRSLQKQGMQEIRVNHITGNVRFETETLNGNIAKAKVGVENLGYKVNEDGKLVPHQKDAQSSLANKYLYRFLICLPFSLLLMAHMVLPFTWLHQPLTQFILATPVFIIGMGYFGVSAYKNLVKGNFHMNVLIAIGSLAAFAYSCVGLFSNHPMDFMFFDTAADIITIVFFGNWLEQVGITSTQKKIKELTEEHVVMANMIAYDDEHNEQIFAIENTALRTGDLVLIRTGEEVPTDCKILSGEAEINEAIITGESTPVFKKKNDILIGGSVLANGNVKCYVTATGEETVRSGIVKMVQDAQSHKPPVQQLADKISGIFVPTVLIISALTLVLNMLIGHLPFATSLMRAVAVLVISCPCAMGLATPAALAVGMGRAARNGILYTRPASMELFASIKQMVFDKTGTLTTGKFTVARFGITDDNMDEATFKTIVFSLEKMSNHPIAKSVSGQWQQPINTKWKKIEEIKGLGMKGIDKENNEFIIGSNKIDDNIIDLTHNLYVKKNGQLIGWLDIADEIRPEAKAIIDFCRKENIKTILLSGDTFSKCKPLADLLGMDEVLAEQTPAQKLQQIIRLSEIAPTAMVGDGINDAPALAKATVSISVAQASQLAVQSASVVLTNNGLTKLPTAIQLGRKTYGTVKSNLAWAFAYNIVFIPVAAFGFLSPTFGALLMGGSDVVLALNSLWLGVKKL